MHHAKRRQGRPRPQRRLVPVKSGAEYLHVHHVTLRRWIKAGLVPGYTTGPRSLRVDLNELDEFVKPVA